MKKINKEKYINALLFFVENCNNAYLGKTKLNKLFYYLDFIYYRDNKKSVTGDVYTCLNYGPVPQDIDEIISMAKKEGWITVREVCLDTRKVEFKSNKNYDLGVFNKKEIELLNNICNEFKNVKTSEIVDQTHLEAPWFYAEMYDEIDYNYSNDIELFIK